MRVPAILEGKLSLAARNASEPLIVAVADARQAIRSTELHSHARGQITAIRRGVVTAGTETEAWVVPPDHAVWMPPHQLHFGYSHGLFDSWSCYVAEPSCAGLPERPCTIRASGLLREAVLHAASWQDPVLDERRLRVALIILDELHAAPVESFSLPMPKDPRLLRIARALLNDPGDRRGMDAWASWAAVSERTLSRRFAAETGYSYTAWRQRVRLMRSLELLADGAPVTTVALDLGYDSVSAFIALFRRTLGMTPSAYFGRYQR